MQTTVNMGVRALKPGKPVNIFHKTIRHREQLTSDGKLGAARYELQEIATVLVRKLTHDLKKIADASAVKIETMVRLDGIHKSYIKVSIGRYYD